MATRREPTNTAIRCISTNIDDIPCEWVMAADAEKDVRMLYLHGGGYVSGSGAFYLTMAGHISVAAQCAVLLPDYRLAPEHRFPAAIEDCIRAHGWLTSSGPAGPAPAKATFIAGDSAGGGLTLATLLSRPPTASAKSRYHAVGIHRPDFDWRVDWFPGEIRPHHES
jgi:acetyl esterase/lipase